MCSNNASRASAATVKVMENIVRNVEIIVFIVVGSFCFRDALSFEFSWPAIGRDVLSLSSFRPNPLRDDVISKNQRQRSQSSHPVNERSSPERLAPKTWAPRRLVSRAAAQFQPT